MSFREVWVRAYVAILSNGGTSSYARSMADQAVRDFESTFSTGA